MRTRALLALALLMGGCGKPKDASPIQLTGPCKVGEMIILYRGTYGCLKVDPWKPAAKEAHGK